MELKNMKKKMMSILFCLLLMMSSLIVVSGTVGAAAPEIPEKPDGPTKGSVNVSYEFYVILVNDSDGHDVIYLFDWGDGFNTGWLGPYPPNTQQGGSSPSLEVLHSWKKIGYYQIKVKAKDNVTGEESEWSEPLSIDIGHRFEIDAVTGGFSISAEITNTLGPSKYTDWQIEIIGGSLPGFHVNKIYGGEMLLKSGETVTVKTQPFFAIPV